MPVFIKKTPQILQNAAVHTGGCLLFILAFLWHREYAAFGTMNHTVLLPWIHERLGITSFSSDFNLEFLKYYHANFVSLCAFLGRSIPLPSLFAAGFIVTLGMIYFAVRDLCGYLFGPEKTRIFFLSMLLLLLWNAQGIEANTLFLNHAFEAPLLANALAIFSLSLLIRAKACGAGLLAGLTLAVHMQIGINLCALSLLYLLIPPKPASILSALKYLGYFLPIFILVIFQHKSVFFDGHSHAGGDFISVARLRIPHHMELNPSKYGFFLGMIFCGLNAFFAARKFGWVRAGMLDRYGKALKISLLVFLLCLVHYFAYYDLKSDLISKFQMLRISFIIHLFAVLFTAAAFTALSESPKILVRAAGLNAFLLMHVFLSPPALKIFILVLIPFVNLCLFLTRHARKHPAAWPKAAQLLLISAGVIFCLNAFLMSTGGKLRLKIPVGMHHPGIIYDVRNSRDRWPWMNLCDWIKRHTGPQEVFITPPYQRGFLVYAERRMVAEWGINPLIFKEHIDEWKKRLSDLSRGYALSGCSGWDCLEPIANGYNRLSPSEVRALAQTYRARYFVAEGDQNFPFKPVFSNKTFTLYDLDAGPSGKTPV